MPRFFAPVPPDRTLPSAPLAMGPFSGAPSLGGWTQEQPLYGVTILAVEDSRFACEALRLMTRRAGARLRRAETLADAQAHLRVYRPDVVLIDLGLPDGRGDGLIRALVTSRSRPSVVLGMSGNPDGRALTLAAGADGFLDKPLENVGQLCRILRPLLPELDILPPPMSGAPRSILDPLALQDDLAFANRALQGDPGPERQRYVAAFLRGIAHHAQDGELEEATSGGLDRLRDALAKRLGADAAFNRSV